MGNNILEKYNLKIAIITDAWEPQVNGVVRTYQNTIKNIGDVFLIHPYIEGLKRKPLFFYKEIEIVINPWKIKEKLDFLVSNNYKIHIATEGPLGFYSRNFLNKKGYKYTSSFHTLFPEFIEKIIKIPSKLTYPFFRWFHKKSKYVLVPTQDMKNYLESKGFNNLKLWSRGVDSEIFNPKRKSGNESYIICVSRVSKEKGLDDFCKLRYNKKVLIGDGPYLNELRKKYPDVVMLGKKEGIELAEWVANADVFVFPSKTDTFGIVILESISCGTPVAAYEQPGPKEVIINGINGQYGENLQQNLQICLSLNRENVYNSSKNWTWKRATKQFIEALK
jgi:glycosyltransferase involved in cell wall biosynthesis